MHLIRAALLAGLAVWLGWAAPAAAERRVALVIGNAGYRHVERLRNPLNDATLIAATLKGLGFELIGGAARTDLDRAEMTRAIEAFGRALQGADVALFYYSGHGLQVSGVNWLVPVDANPARAQDLDFQMVDAELVLRQMDGAGTRLNLVILDACRNNPFAISGVRGERPGLAEMRAPEGTMISYATQPGAVAFDGGGENSPYTLALSQAMRKPGSDVFRTFNDVGLAVKQATGGEQQPWVSNSPIAGDFYFAGVVVPPPPQPAPASPAPVPSPATPSASRSPALPAARPRPAPARPVAAAPRPVRAAGCGEVMTRAQLGEPLSAADQALMRHCGR